MLTLFSNFRLVDSKDILITFWKCVEFLETTANFRFLESFQDRIKNWKNIIDDLREMRGRYLDNSVISFMEYCISMRLTSPLPILPRNPFTLPEMQWLIKAFEHASPYALTSSLEEYVKEVIMSTPNSSETKDQVKNYHLFHTMMGIISLDKNDLESAKSHLTIAVALVDMLKCALDYAVLEDIRLDYVLMRPENTNCIYILLIQCYLREWKETELELLQSQGTDLRDITKPVLVLKLSDTSKLYHRQSTLKARATFSEVLAFRSRRVRIMPTGEKWFRLEKNHILDATTDYILLSATNYNDDPHNSKLYDKIVWSLLMCGDIHVDTILFFDFLRFYFSLNKACQPVGEKFIQSIDESFMTTKIEQIIASLRYLRNSSLHIKSDDTNLDYPWNWWLISPCLLGNNPENVVFEDCLPASAKWYKIHDSNTGVMSRTITNKIRGILKHETGEIKQRENLRLSFHLVDLWKENYTGYHQGALPSKIEEYLEHHYGLRDIV
ncbi:unnamed protein product [Kuraishia capsulata CBS 1993]|uniref:Uncharacterized protein n=1 Tax=Kuraishia capsulata CBS 1993 TaxID=1382522 RepID=W6ML39_9ASCO|nr:uncharacterized protein KUCA_T00002782001 [Kuraishia capsulata CBS 1993]CDK26808.1 unnamed protein product [Kuraishia capsulata CBS 1993]